MSGLAEAAEEFKALYAVADEAYVRLLREVQEAARGGMTHTKISKETGLSRMTIRKHCVDLYHVVEVVEVPTV
ncbi:hypothetical protein UFOVP957_11 [uncultured Caudovirales phage]|uniref:Uncharacterized protein n=1 Tax=uncultured Caudovirales phage TaxID=2100421 RepID=A0A6J5PSB4_9CAUD|nr:hypothetical protein UFOVP283_37 [uncultured Caudovirales phage]CAB4173887.1 hypothetical protein UFOVP957_11 [uncultured Caudovirales phage]CAB4192390.1 hypothetical protein UFOVP1231_28 [uncultured Caudovirales phage]